MNKKYLVHRPRRAGKTSERIQQLVAENIKLRTALRDVVFNRSLEPMTTEGTCYYCNCAMEDFDTGEVYEKQHYPGCVWVVAQEELKKYGIKSRRDGHSVNGQ